MSLRDLLKSQTQFMSVGGGERQSIVVAAAAQLKTRSGRVYRILVSAGTGAIDVYDDPATTNNKVWGIAATAVGAIYELDCPMKNGIRVVAGAGTTVTVIWS